MTQHPCPTCPALQAEVIQLQATVSMLLRIIAAAQRECMTLATEAGQPLPKRVAPAFWNEQKGIRKGKGAAAGRVLGKLKG